MYNHSQLDTYDSAGDYTITLIVSDGICIDSTTKDITILNSVGIKEHIHKDSVLLNVYPNPSNQSIIIHYDLPANTKKSYISFYNFTGRKVKAYPINQKQNTLTIRTNEIGTGMFLVQLVADGVIVAMKKIIIN